MSTDGESKSQPKEAEEDLKRVQEHLGEEDKQLEQLEEHIHEAEKKSKKVIREPEE
jgi:hypothetical protein